MEHIEVKSLIDNITRKQQRKSYLENELKINRVMLANKELEYARKTYALKSKIEQLSADNNKLFLTNQRHEYTDKEMNRERTSKSSMQITLKAIQDKNKKLQNEVIELENTCNSYSMELDANFIINLDIIQKIAKITNRK